MTTNEKESHKVTKAGLSYTVGNYFLKGIGFISVPVFARIMTTSDFGVFNTFLTYEAILYMFVGLALHSSIKNSKYEYGDNKVDEYTSSITLVPIFVGILMLIIGNIASDTLFRHLGLDRFQINMLVLYSFSSAILYIYQARMILQYKTQDYLKLSYFNAITSIVLSLLFIWFVFPNARYMGRILGATVPMILIAVYIIMTQFKKAAPKINSHYLRFGLKLSIPIIPHGIGQILLSSFDRVMITNMVSKSAAGLYSFAYTIYSLLLVAGNSVSAVFEPWAFEKLSKNDHEMLQERSSIFVIGMAIISVLVMLVTPELVLILGSEQYCDAIPAVYPVILGGFFAMAYTMPAVVEYYKKKTGAIAVGTVSAALINLVLNYIFIPQYGFIAAAYTTFVSYLLYYVFHTVIAYRLITFHIVPLKTNILSSIGLIIGTSISFYLRQNFMIRYLIVFLLLTICIVLILKIRTKD